MFSELLGAERSLWNVNIFATDLNESALSFAMTTLHLLSWLSSSMIRFIRLTKS